MKYFFKQHQFYLLIGIGAFLLSCTAPSRTVKRISDSQQTDISGRWNDTDARIAAESMIRDLLSQNWLSHFKEQQQRPPVIMISTISNRTSEHINTGIIGHEMEKELLNSGQVRFVASSDERKEIREERLDQQSYSSVESAKELANEQAADFILRGNLSSIEDVFDSERVVLYKIYLELIDIENNTKVWIGTKNIKKYIHQDHYRL